MRTQQKKKQLLIGGISLLAILLVTLVGYLWQPAPAVPPEAPQTTPSAPTASTPTAGSPTTMPTAAPGAAGAAETQGTTADSPAAGAASSSEDALPPDSLPSGETSAAPETPSEAPAEKVPGGNIELPAIPIN